MIGAFVVHLLTRSREREARIEMRKDAQLERRNEFQRQMLRRLQHAAMKLIQSTAKIQHFDRDTIRKFGKIRAVPYPEDLSNEDQRANAITAILGVRVRDEKARKLLQQMKDEVCAVTLFSTEIEEGERHMREASATFVKLNECIGELLRALDDIEIAN
jgi:hypothetical protein